MQHGQLEVPVKGLSRGSGRTGEVNQLNASLHLLSNY